MSVKPTIRYAEQKSPASTHASLSKILALACAGGLLTGCSLFASPDVEVSISTNSYWGTLAFDIQAIQDTAKITEVTLNRGNCKVAIPGLVDLSDMARAADRIAKIVLESTQEMLLKLALQMARDDYETRRDRQQQGIALAKASGKYAGRKPDLVMQQRIVALRKAGYSIRATADMAGCSQSQVKRIWARQSASMTESLS